MEKGDVADAIMELFSTWESIDRPEQMDYIMRGMKPYAKHQREVILCQCLAEIENYLYHQEDYALGKQFLEALIQELLPVMKKHELYSPHFEYKLQLFLIEVNLKMGKMVVTRQLVEQCKTHMLRFAKRPEDVWELFSKEALLLLREGDSLQAESLMEKVCNSAKTEYELLKKDMFLAEQNVDLVPEYYLKAKSLYIYILLSGKKQEGRYQKLSALLDEVMNPDDVRYERLCRYRSLLEAEEGHVKEALKWLLMAEGVGEGNVLKEQLRKYLAELQRRKDSRDIQFGVLYYLTIADEAGAKDGELRALMCRVLEEQQGLLEYLGAIQNESILPNEFDVSRVSAGESKELYYPMELICELWKKLMRK